MRVTRGWAAGATFSKSTHSILIDANGIAGRDIVSVTPQVFHLLAHLIHNGERVVREVSCLIALRRSGLHLLLSITTAGADRVNWRCAPSEY